MHEKLIYYYLFIFEFIYFIISEHTSIKVPLYPYHNKKLSYPINQLRLKKNNNNPKNKTFSNRLFSTTTLNALTIIKYQTLINIVTRWYRQVDRSYKNMCIHNSNTHYVLCS